jgi:hypothetical protein
MAYVSLAGLFEAGTAVSLYAVADEAVLRVGASAELVGRRLVDSKGNVGFDGLEDAARFIASGHGAGESAWLEVRCRSLREDEASELAQPPIAAVTPLVGTQEAPLDEPAPGEPSAILQIGVPDGVPVDAALAA